MLQFFDSKVTSLFAHAFEYRINACFNLYEHYNCHFYASNVQ